MAKKTKKQKAKESKPKVRKKAIPPSKRHKSKKDYNREYHLLEERYYTLLNQLDYMMKYI